jgi:enoyl-CoA hydratase/carnithine racemase
VSPDPRTGPEATTAGQVTCERRDGVAVVTFDHIRRHNALTQAMSEAANVLFATLAEDPEVRVVVLRGAGERAFMSGTDIDEQDDDAGRASSLAEATKMIAAVGDLPMPVIAAVRGYCLGAGVAVATQADLRLASDDAVFGLPATRLGLVYPYNDIARLTALTGPGVAAELLLTGRRARADEALRWGLVQAVHAPNALDDAAMTLASAIALNAPLSLRAAKRGVRVAADAAHDGKRRAEVDRLIAACFASEDYVEGRAAFHERRTPRFTGR